MAPCALTFLVCFGGFSAAAQSGSAQQQPDAQTNAGKSPAITPVTTTVVVHGEASDDYLPASVTVGALASQPLKDAPLSATVISRDLMNDQVSRLLSDVVKNDASIQNDYVPVGYYGVYQIRGFAIDLATGLEIDGMTIAGEQDVPLENKESVELLNGLAGVESGVAAGGGTIGYVTKRPALVKAVDFATDQYGTAFGATDLGRFFGSRKQVGARINLAGERIETYMNGTEGWRAVGAGAADWRISPKAMLEGNFEYQHKTQADGSGMQLLGGTELPDIHRVFRSTLLGEQSWAPPDTYDTFNTGARLNLTLSRNWTAFAAASLSHSLIQDNVIYAYGSSIDPDTYEANCPNAPGAPSYFFCPDGTYGIYDYRNPGELRIDGEAEAMATGVVKTGAVTHTITLGGELFLRTVHQPGFYTIDNPYSPDDIVQDGSVYTYLGPENIYQPTIAYPIEDPVQKAGPRRLYENSRQSSFLLQDRVQLPGRIQLTVGGRYDALRDHNYSAWATTPCVQIATPGPANDPCPTTYDESGLPIYSIPNVPSLTDKPVWLPQFAATFSPVKTVTLYSNYGVLLSLGPQAPWWADNGSQFLAPYNTRQVEVGAKYQPGQRILISGALFHMRAPFFYPKILAGPDDLNFVSEGRETHNGIEINAQGKAANWLWLTASAAGLGAKSDNTGTPAYDGKQVINVPHVHTAVSADLHLPRVNGLALLPGWSYSSRKEALRDGTVSVPAYNLFSMGLRYTPGGEQGRVSFRIYADNIMDRKYWSDTGANAGDTFLWLGAPAIVRASAHYSF